jgi:hypothetical protein
MARRIGRTVKPFPAPAALFPLVGEPTTALDLIPDCADPTGRGRRAWEILSKLPITEGEFAGQRIGEHSPPWQKKLTILLFGHTGVEGLRMITEAFICMSKKKWEKQLRRGAGADEAAAR